MSKEKVPHEQAEMPFWSLQRPKNHHCSKRPKTRWHEEKHVHNINKTKTMIKEQVRKNSSERGFSFQNYKKT